MSHVAAVDLEVKDLEALDAACERLGTVELARDVHQYKWWGTHVGDYPIPAGFTKAELGRCDHVIRLKGNRSAYEVGVVQKDGRYQLLWDFYGQHGAALQKAIGKDGALLKCAYGTEAAKRAARRQGFRVVREQVLANGKVKLTVQR